MNRSLFPTRPPPRPTIIGWFFALIIGTSIASHANSRELVLVSSQDANFETIPLQDLRRIYLGIPLRGETKFVKPYRNTSNLDIERYFYSHIMFMTEDNYKRLVLERSFRQGVIRPPEINDEAELVNLLRRDNVGVSFMWREQVNNYDGLKVLQVLWQENE